MFRNVGKAGSDVCVMAEGLGRMISLMLRFSSHLTPQERVQKIVDELSYIGGGTPQGFGKDRVRSLPDAVAKVLAIHYQLNSEEVVSTTNSKTSSNGLTNGDHKESETTKEIEILDAAIESEDAPHMTRILEESEHFDICPACGSATLVYEEGCKKCYGCGYSEC